MSKKRVVLTKGLMSKQTGRRITVSVSEELNHQITLAAVKEGYGMKGKSHWVNEAIKGFLDDPGWIDHLEADRTAGKDKPITLVISADVEPLMAEGVRKLVGASPLARHPQNQIVRGAMVWRLLGLDSRPLRKIMAEQPGSTDI